jgi:phosphoribosyl 1,2-cyclic phosphate phosphodiesterase
MELIFLGTGTSNGIPVIGCSCGTCTSSDPKDKRTRSSVFIRHQDMSILIDASTDLRQQLLREDISDIDYILFTHHHADHIHGLDDIRPINWKMKKKILCYASSKTAAAIRTSFPYIFHCDQLGGGVPEIELFEVDRDFILQKSDSGITVSPIEVMHGKWTIFGYRLGNFAYITDASSIPEGSYDLLKDIDILVLNALRMRPHSTHFSLEEALIEVEKIKPQRTYLTHICHDLKHSFLMDELKDRKVFPAYDGLRLNISL